MKKCIIIDFKDDFVPPEMFERSKCNDCPFYAPNDDDYPTCQLREWNEIYYRTLEFDTTCPIKKYFN